MKPGIKCNRCDKWLSAAVKCDKPGCEHPEYHQVMHDRFREKLPTKYGISIIGGINAGKTYYLLSLVDALLERSGETVRLLSQCGITDIEMIDRDSNELFYDLKKRSMQGERLHLTVPGTKLGFFSLIITLDNNRTYEIVLFNSSGEKIEDEYLAKKFNTDSHEMKGIATLYFVDPMEDTKLNDILSMPKEGAACRNHKMAEHIYKVMKLVNDRAKIVSNPLAVCISKFDLLLHRRPKDVPAQPFVEPGDRNFFENIQRISEELKALLDDCSHTVNTAEIDDKFQRVSYFAVAPFGRNDLLAWENREPKGILAPFFWVLKQLNIIKEEYGTNQRRYSR